MGPSDGVPATSASKWQGDAWRPAAPLHQRQSSASARARSTIALKVSDCGISRLST